MKIDAAVKKETLIIAAGTSALSALMVVVFVLIGRFDLPVVLGALLGTAGAVLNFFLMGLSVQSASGKLNAPATEAEADEKAEADEQDGRTVLKPVTEGGKQVRRQMQFSYTMRMLLMVVICLVGALLPCFNMYATLLPMLFPRVVLMIQGALMKKEA